MNPKQIAAKLHRMQQHAPAPSYTSPDETYGSMSADMRGTAFDYTSDRARRNNAKVPVKPIDITGLPDNKVVQLLKRFVNMRGLRYPVTIVDRTNANANELVLEANYELSDFIDVWTVDSHFDEDMTAARATSND